MPRCQRTRGHGRLERRGGDGQRQKCHTWQHRREGVLAGNMEHGGRSICDHCRLPCSATNLRGPGIFLHRGCAGAREPVSHARSGLADKETHMRVYVSQDARRSDSAGDRSRGGGVSGGGGRDAGARSGPLQADRPRRRHRARHRRSGGRSGGARWWAQVSVSWWARGGIGRRKTRRLAQARSPGRPRTASGAGATRDTPADRITSRLAVILAPRRR